MAVMLLDSLTDGLEALVEKLPPVKKEKDDAKRDRVNTLLQKLNEEEGADYSNMLDNPPRQAIAQSFGLLWNPEGLNLKRYARGQRERAAIWNRTDYNMFLKANAFCHFARLPAETRFKGLLTEGPVGTVYDQKYDPGYSLEILSQHHQSTGKPWVDKTSTRPKDEPYLISIMGGREGPEGEFCSPDADDYFMVSSVDGKMKMTVPNDAEAAYYPEFNAPDNQGKVMVCLNKCSYGHCAEDDMHSFFFGALDAKNADSNKPDKDRDPASMVYGDVKMSINGVPVVNGIMYDRKCSLLMHKGANLEEQMTWTKNKKGRYEIEMEIVGAKTYSQLKFGAIVTF